MFISQLMGSDAISLPWSRGNISNSISELTDFSSNFHIEYVDQVEAACDVSAISRHNLSTCQNYLAVYVRVQATNIGVPRVGRQGMNFVSMYLFSS